MAETPPEKLKRLQALPLPEKIDFSKHLISEWYDAWDGDVSVSFSGGKDSTVLLNLARSIYLSMPAVFCNTGLEYPEVLSFVKKHDNVKWVRPKLRFREVIKKYGYPVVSKENSQKLFEIRNTRSKKLLHKRLCGDNNKYRSGKLPNKWHFLINAPFKISEKCCHYLKKQPMKKFTNIYLGNMSEDSHARRQRYVRNSGCGQIFNNNAPQSHPLYFWTEKNIWEYLKSKNIRYSKIYDIGYDRTGCMFCMFGVHLEKYPNRFQKMKITHPKHWEYCIYKLDLKTPLDFMGIPYIPEKNPQLSIFHQI